MSEPFLTRHETFDVGPVDHSVDATSHNPDYSRVPELTTFPLPFSISQHSSILL